MIKHFKTHNEVLFLNNLIIKLINKECLKEEDKKLALMSKKRNIDKNKRKNEIYIYCKKAVHFKNNY